MKRRIYAFLLAFIAVAFFMLTPVFVEGGALSTASAASVKISSMEISETMKVITSYTTGAMLKVDITPANATNQVLEWTSSNENVCKVDSVGFLYPKANGKCTITAKSTDGSNLSVSCQLLVADRANKIYLDPGSKTLNAGEEFTITATVETASGSTYNGFVKWTSTDENIATVDENGKVTAHYPGTTTITANPLDGMNRQATCFITVTQAVEGIALPSSKVCAIGSTVTLTPTFTPEYVTNKNVTWTSSDNSVATVDSKGVVKGISEGSAVITAVSEDGGFIAECTVNVERFPDSVSLNYASIRLKVGGKKTLIETVLPYDATNQEVTWHSSDPSVATVSKNGVVKGIKGGTATITVKTKRGGIKTKCYVTVIEGVSSVSIKNAPETMYKGQTYTIKATVKPSTANNKKVTWKSSHPSVIKIDSETGKMTALKTGRAKITVTTDDGSFTASCKITVTKKINVLGVSLNKTKKTVPKGKSYTLVPSFTPANASDKSVIWSSSDEKVAKVSSKGVVTALKAGTAEITCTTVDGKYTARCKVTVTVPVSSVKLSKTKISIGTGRSYTLKAVISPSDATNKNVTWSSSDSKIATVDKNGTVKGLKKGTAVITAKTADGSLKAKCKVTVYKSVTGVKLSLEKTTVPKGERIQLVATVSPSDAGNKGVTWSSSDPSIATVSDSGMVTGKRKGTVIITVKTDDGSFEASCSVEVLILAQSITLDYSTVTLDVGKRKQLTYTMKPSNVSMKSVTWKTSDKSIVKVSSKGIILAVAKGTATITATSADGNVMARCRVTVNQPVTGVKIKATKTSVRIGSEITLAAQVLPSDATVKTVFWSSSDTSVATVSASGVVKGLKKGTAEITCTTADGMFKATIKISVVKSVTGVTLNKTVVTLNKGKKTALSATIIPADANNQKVTWKSSNNDVATVSDDGVVTAVSSGYAEITVITKDGKKTAVCQVQVISSVTGVSLNKSRITVVLGKNKALTATVLPADASNKKLVWTSSNTAVVKVSQKGTLVPVGEGTAVVTVKSADGGFTDTCKVTVIKKQELKLAVNSVVNNTKKITLEVDVLSFDSTPVFNTADKKITVNGKSVKWSVSKKANEYGNYYIYLDISSLGLVKGEEVKIKLPAGVIKNKTGTQYSSAYTMKYTLD